MQDSPCQELKQYKLNLRHDFFAELLDFQVYWSKIYLSSTVGKEKNHSFTLSTQIFASSLIPLADKHR